MASRNILRLMRRNQLAELHGGSAFYREENENGTDN